MEKPSLKPNVWIDESGMLVNNPAMQAIIGLNTKIATGKIVMVSTPSGKPFQAHMENYADWSWFEFSVKKTAVGKLLYG